MSLLQDLRFAVRMLAKDKWFTGVAALALALGIGVNNAVFTLVNAVLIRGLPFDAPDRILSIGVIDARGRHMGVSRLDFLDWREQSRSLDGLTPIVREEMRAIEPDLPLFNIKTMDELMAQRRWPFKVFGSMFAIFAAIALLLSAVGLYAVTAYSVSQRTAEIGVRMALGAQPGHVLWLVLRRSFAQLAIGLPIGIAGALGVGRILQSMLVQTSARDPLTIASIGALMTAVSVAACVWPARRATRLDPVNALRYE